MDKVIFTIGNYAFKRFADKRGVKKLLDISFSVYEYSISIKKVVLLLGNFILTIVVSIILMILAYVFSGQEWEISFLIFVMSFIALYLHYKKFIKPREEILESLSMDLESLCKELSILLSTGLSVDDSFTIISKSKNKSRMLQRLVYVIEEEKRKGGSISEAISIFAKYFRSKHLNNLIVIIVATKEKGVNKPSEKLLSLANEIQLERRFELKRKSEKISSKLLLPLMLSLIAIMAMLLVPAFLQFNF